VLLEAHDSAIFTEEDKIDGKQHTNGVDAARGDDPKAPSALCPPLSFAEKTYKTAKIIVRDHDIGTDKGLARLVVHTHRPGLIATVHPGSPMNNYRNYVRPQNGRLIDRLTLAAPHDDAENNQRTNSRDDAD
jgi:hypothetical protein